LLREPTDTESTGTSSAPDRDLTQERSPSQSAIGHEIADSKLSDLPTPSKGDHSFPWPVIQALLQCNSINLSQWDGGTQSVEKWLVDISQDFDAPLLRGSPTDIHYDDNAMLNLKPGQPITLNRGYVEAICSIYFETFHCTYPILDRSHFFSTILPDVCSKSFDRTDPGSALVLSVLALGVLAQEGASGVPITDEAGRRTGIRGGSAERPPGLDFLNAAKSRLGITLAEWSLNSLSSHILCAAYYSQCSRNLVFPMTPESCSSTYQLGILAFSKSKLYYMQEFGEKHRSR